MTIAIPHRANLAYESFRTDDVFTAAHKIARAQRSGAIPRTRAGLQVAIPESSISNYGRRRLHYCPRFRFLPRWRERENRSGTPNVQLSADLRF